MDKLHFLTTEFPRLVSELAPNTKGNWGVMNAQQMVEHMADSVSQATGNNNQKLHTAPDMVEKYRSFAMSDKEFKPNTPNALLPGVPAIPTKATMALAIQEYKVQLAAFNSYFETHKGARITNPFFGDLNFEEWTHLLHKHSIHHLKQFGKL